MADILFQQVAAPNFASVNALAAQAAQHYQNAFKTLQDTAKNAQTAVRDTNTARLMDYLNTAQTTGQFNTNQFQQGLQQLRDGLKGEYNTKEYQQKMDTLPDRLTQREMQGIQLQQAQDAYADVGLKNQIAQKLANHDYEGAQQLMSQAKTDISNYVTMADQLRTSALNRQSTTHNMNMDVKRFGLDQERFGLEKDKFQWQKDEAAEQKAFLDSQIAALGGGSPASSGGISGGKNIDQWDNLLAKYAKETGVPFNVLKAHLEQESGGRSGVTSSSGAQGLLQLLPSTAARFVGKGANLYDPETNIKAGAMYLASLGKRYGGDWSKAGTAYFAGEGNMDKWVARAKQNGTTWAAEMARKGKDGKALNPRSYQYLQDIAKRYQKYAPEAGKAVTAQAKQYQGIPFKSAGQSTAKTVDNPFMGMMSLAGNDPKTFKIMADLKNGTDKLAADVTKEEYGNVYKNHPLVKNLGSYTGNFDDWKADNDSRIGKKVAAAIELNKDAQKMPEVYKTALAEALKQQAQAAYDRDWTWFGGWDSEDYGSRAASMLQSFKEAQMQRSQVDAELLNNDYQAQIIQQQMTSDQERQKQLQQLLMKRAGL